MYCQIVNVHAYYCFYYLTSNGISLCFQASANLQSSAPPKHPKCTCMTCYPHAILKSKHTDTFESVRNRLERLNSETSSGFLKHCESFASHDFILPGENFCSPVCNTFLPSGFNSINLDILI